MEYYSTIKRNKLNKSSNCMYLKGSMLSKKPISEITFSSSIPEKRQNYKDRRQTNSYQQPKMEKGSDNKRTARSVATSHRARDCSQS